MTQDLETRVRDFLAAHHCISLATSGADGPWAASLMYAADGFDLYLMTRPESRHGRHIGTEGRVAGTINDDVYDWPKLRGIQLEGVCTRLADPEATLRAFALYVGRYPGIKQLYGGGDDLASMIASDPEHEMYRLRPDHLAYLDHTVSFERATLF